MESVGRRAYRGSLASLTALGFLAALFTLGLAEAPSATPAAVGILTAAADSADHLSAPLPSSGALEDLAEAESSEESESEGRDRALAPGGHDPVASQGPLAASEAFTRVARSRAVQGSHRPRGPPAA